MSLGNKIAQLRKNQNITQDALAQRLGVTNQAVSKWESDQCCPDVTLLPKIADIFGVSLDELFGRTAPAAPAELPWPNDDTLRVVVYVGHRLVGASLPDSGLEIRYEGPVLNVDSCISISCGDVAGNVSAKADVSCGNVLGHVNAGSDVHCGDVAGNVAAGCDAACGDVDGSVFAGCDVECGNVGGNVEAGCDVTIRK